MQDLLAAPILCLSTFVLARLSWKTARRLLPEDDFVATTAHTLVLVWGTIVLAAFLIGFVGLLRPYVLIPIALLLSWSLARFAAGMLRDDSEPIAATAVARFQARVSIPFVIWTVVLACWAVYVGRDGLGRYPRGWDTIMYHIPLIDQWLRAESLTALDCAHWYTTGNNELIGLWIVGPFTGDFLIGLHNIPGALLLAIGSMKLGASLGLSRIHRHATALAVVLTSVIYVQLVSADTDVAAAGAFVVTVWYGSRYIVASRIGDLLLAAVALGLLSGTKYYALGYAGACWLFVTFGVWMRRGAFAAMRPALALALGALIWGGPWYLRNAIVGGGPLYPAGLTPSTHVMARLYPAIATTSFLGNGDLRIPELTARMLWRWGGAFHLAAAALSPLAVVWLAISGGIRMRRLGRAEGSGALRLAIATLLFSSGWILLKTPFSVEDQPGTLNQLQSGYCPFRYGTSFLSLAAVSFAFMLDDVARRSRELVQQFRGFDPTVRLHGHRSATLRRAAWAFVSWIPTIVLVGLTATQVSNLFAPIWRIPDDAWIDGLLLSANVILAVGAWNLIGPLFVRARYVLAAALLVASGWFAAHLSTSWHAGFGANFARFSAQLLLRDIPPTAEGDHCVVVLQTIPYPFMGSRRRIRVVNPLIAPSAEQIPEFLKACGATYVIGPSESTSLETGWNNFQHAKRWLETSPLELVPLYKGASSDVYRVKDKVPGTPPPVDCEPCHAYAIPR